MFVLKFESDERSVSSDQVQEGKRIVYVATEGVRVHQDCDGSYMFDGFSCPSVESMRVDGTFGNFDRCYIMNETGQTVDKVEAASRY